MTVDFNLHCLPNMDFSHGIESAHNVVNNLKLCAIKHAVLIPPYDHTIESVSDFLKRRRSKIKMLTRNGIKLIPAANVPIEPGISDIKDFSNLSANETELIYLSLSKTFHEEIIDRELHQIMHKHKLIPIFSDVDHFIFNLSEPQLYKIFSTPYAAFQFNISSLSDKIILKHVRALISSGKCVLFGTGISDYSNRNLNYNLPVKQFEKWFGKEFFTYYLLKCEQLLK